MAGPFDAGTVSARLVLNLDEWSANLEKAKKDTTTLGSAITAHKVEIEQLGKAFAVAGAAIVGSLGLMLKGATDYTLEIGRMSTRTGIATETLSGLREAGEKSGLAFDNLGVSLKIFGSHISDAYTGSAVANETLKKLGITITDTSGNLKPMDQLLMETADKFKVMPNGIEKSALAVDLFGRSGTSMIAMLNRGSGGIKDFIDEQKEMGTVVTLEGVAKFKAFSHSLMDLEHAFLGVKIAIANAIIPVVKTVSDVFGFVVVKVQQVMNLFPGLTSLITIVVGVFGSLILVLGTTLLLSVKLAGTWSQMSTAISMLAGKVVAASTAMSLSIPIYAAIAAGIMAVNAMTNAYAASQDKQMSEIVKSAERVGATWKWVAEIYRSKNPEIIKVINSIRESGQRMGQSQEEIGDRIYNMFGKIIERTKQVAADTAAMAGKVLDVQKELTDKLRTLTTSEYAERIYQAKKYYDDLRAKVKGSIDEGKVAADIDKAQALEVGKIKKEQYESTATSHKKASDKIIKQVQAEFKQIKILSAQEFNTALNNDKGIVTSAQQRNSQMTTYFSQFANTTALKLETLKKKFLGFTVTAAKDFGSYVQVMQEGINSFFSNMGQATEANLKNQLQKLDTEYEARKKWIMENVTDLTERDKLLSALDEETAKKKRQAEYDAAKKKRDLDIFQAVTNMGVAITASWKLGWPLGMFAAAFALAACMMQISNIKKAPLPAMAEGGLINQPMTVLAGEAGPEAIVPMRELKRMLGISPKGGGSKTVNFGPISAIDSRGLDILFSESIIPRIRRAMGNEMLTVPVKAVR